MGHLSSLGLPELDLAVPSIISGAHHYIVQYVGCMNPTTVPPLVTEPNF